MSGVWFPSDEIDRAQAAEARVAVLEDALRGLIRDHGCWCSYFGEGEKDEVDERNHELACYVVRAALGKEQT